MNLSGDSLLLPIKCFLKILSHLSYGYYDYMMHGFVFSYLDHLIIPGSSIRMIKFKLHFQTGSKNDGYTLAPFFAFSILK